MSPYIMAQNMVGWSSQRTDSAKRMYGINPFAAQNATGDMGPNHVTSIFGALPYPGTASAVAASPHTLVTFRFTSLSPTILDCKVVGPNNETCYRVVTRGQGYTLLKDGAGHDVALVEWQSHPTVEVQGVVAKQPAALWLQLSADTSARTMCHRGVCYAWVPLDRFLHLFAPDSREWLARVTRSANAVLLELAPRAIELGLMSSAVLATLLLQAGRHID